MGAEDTLIGGRELAANGKPKSAVLIVNTRARRGEEWLGQAKECLQNSGLELKAAMPIRDPRRLLRHVEQAVASGVELVIIGGGDGSISASARHFVGKDTVMGVLPLGTGNAFARDLSIAADVETACDAIINGKTVAVDLGRAGDDYFVNVCTVGLTTLIASELTTEAKRRFGRAVYLIALVQAISKVKPFRAMLDTPEGKLDFKTLQVVIGNGRYHAGPFPIAPDASITDGKLSIYGLTNTSKSALIKLAFYLRTGRHVELPEVQWISTKGGRLSTEPIRKVTVDGEIVFHTPLDFQVVPSALRVRVPQQFQV